MTIYELTGPPDP